MPRAGLAPATVVAAGAELADEIGFAGVTMGLLAERVGVKAPSLYKHVASLEALQRGIATQARRELGDALTRAAVGKSGPDAVRAYAEAWRHWAVDHPGRYAATVRAPTNAEDDEEDRRAANEGLQIMYAVLAGFGLRGTRALDAARVLRSALHGFATLESAGGFGLPRDVDRSFGFLLDTLITGLSAEHPTSTEDEQDDRPITHPT
ncbi:TetR/AcrR family transcriptional regulator [Paractinoplanes durhamensis]|uniref:TetR family transcriptional regulator n=1 Tax=Paractinoplanes durhamensis TaxID=113563 RepID=A0ABQ3YZV8_9ACTN|nr:TetR/AcrR family transcriptional regulator [Actinoplanes durhamensis]GIE03127.1 TetR family transcriptional regulator [Actinoplanes durhamensis]